MKEKHLQFKCPSCGKTKIDEILCGVTQASTISVILESGNIDYDPGSFSYDEGDIAHYQCAACCEILEDDIGEVDSPRRLVEWVKKNCPQSGDVESKPTEGELVERISNLMIGKSSREEFVKFVNLLLGTNYDVEDVDWEK